MTAANLITTGLCTTHPLKAAALETLEQRRLLSTTAFATYGDPIKVADAALTVMADFDGDGYLDLASGGTVQFGASDGTLGKDSANYYAAAGAVFGIAAGDLDNDGRAELIALADGNLLVVEFDERDPTLATTYHVGNNADNPALGDFDGDGDLDVAFNDYTESFADGYSYTQYLSIAINNGQGGFSSTQSNIVTSAIDPSSAAVVDLDGDGRDELLKNRWFDGSGLVSALFELQPSFEMQTRTSTSTSLLGGSAVAVDTNGDGSADRAVGVRNAGGETFLYQWTATDSTLSRDDGTRLPGNGTMLSFTSFFDATAGSAVLVLGESDGAIDVYTLPDGSGGSLGVAVASVDAAGDPAILLSAHDIDGDGNRDLVVSGTSGSYIARASGTVRPAAPKATFTISGKQSVGLTIKFVASDALRDGHVFTWTIDGETIKTGSRITHTFKQGGDHTVRLTVTDRFNRSATASRTIAVKAVNKTEKPTNIPPAEKTKPVVAPTFPERVPARSMQEFRLKVAQGLGKDAADATFVIDWHDGTSATGNVDAEGNVVLSREFITRGNQPYTLLVRDAGGTEYVSSGEFGVGDSTDVEAAPVTKSRGTVLIHGTGGDDVIQLRPVGSNSVGVFINGQSRGTYDARSIEIDSGAGNDVIDLSQLSKTHYATSTIRAGHGDDTVIGGVGRDVIFGMDGNDVLDGGAGDDYIGGSAGDDRMIGGRGNDTLVGGRGDGDVADYSRNTSTQGVDISLDDTANDRDGMGGIDQLAQSVEFILGGEGDDRLAGDDRANYINGYGGDDQIWGHGGNDDLEGGRGRNLLDGGDGDDILLPLGRGVFSATSTDANVIRPGAGNDRGVLGRFDTTEGVLENLFDSDLDLFKDAA